MTFFVSTKKISCLCLLFVSIVLSSCSPQIDTSSPQDSLEQTIVLVDISQVIEGEHLFAYTNQNQLFITDTDNPGKAAVITQLSVDEKPANPTIGDIKISPKKTHVVWYSNQKGFISYNLNSQKKVVVRQANNWLNRNPYFEFNKSGDKLFLIDHDGTTFVTIDIDANKTKEQKIPEPFGNVFRVSPDEKTILFISGFGQTEQVPEFMFTDIDVTRPLHFSAQTELNKRFLVVWLPDSSGVVVVEKENTLSLIPRDTQSEKKQYYQIKDAEVSITNLEIKNELLYFYSTDKKWRAIDVHSGSVVIKVPIEIAQGIHRPLLVPWSNNKFLIEETMRLNPQEYRRLWITNTIGEKTLLIGKYQETSLNDITPAL